MTCHTLLYHAIKFFTLFGVCTRNTVICENPCELPLIIFLYKIGVMLHLCLIAGCLFITVGTDTTVCCNLQFRLDFLIYRIADSFSCQNHRNILTQLLSPRFLSNCRHIQPVQMGQKNISELTSGKTLYLPSVFVPAPILISCLKHLLSPS